jgi:hypothetical protein
MTLLIPQLPANAAGSLLEQMAQARPIDLDPGADLSHPQAITQTTGGLPVAAEHLRELRESIVTAAREYGFPDSRPAGFLHFELEVAQSLARWKPLWDAEGLPSGEALRNDCWTFITIVLLPDVALWRWPIKGGDDETGSRSWKGRMVGGSRNAFQRIFRRVMCLDRGADHPDRWGLIRDLQEDDFSAILERPGLSSNRDTAVCLGEEYLAMKRRLSQLSASVRQEVYRQATKAIRAYGVVQPLDLMPTEGRTRLIHDAFRRYEDDLMQIPEPAKTTSDIPDAAVTGTERRSDARPARRSLLRRLLDGG